ncbi:MAG TPA: peptidylprolyl isomerase, partial [Chthoniobacterales bacterium]
EKLRPGETSEPFRSHLGFHLIRLTDRKAPHLLEFQEARPEILLAIVNQRRASIANRFADDLAGFAQFRPSF